MASVFTQIINREIPADILYEDEDFIVVRDIAPKAPFHALIIPKHPYRDVYEAGRLDPPLVGRIAVLAGELTAADYASNFRLIFNNGAKAGQEVFHLHGHVLAGGLGD